MTKRIQVVGVVAAVGIALILGAAWAQKQAGGPKIPKPPPTAFMSNFYTRTISGKVTRLDGTPAANIPVHARFRRNMTGAEGENKDVTDAQGRYAMRVAAEEFVVMVDNGGTSYLSESHLVDVRAKSATDINLMLHLTPRITIRIRDALTGQPVGGVKIVRSGKPDAQTGQDGTFAFRMLGFEEHLELRPEDSRITPAPGYSFYRSLMVGSLSGTRRDPYVLEPDTDVIWDVKTYRNEPGAEQTVIRGFVTGPGGRRVAGARVRMRRPYSNTVETYSDAAGFWMFSTRRIQEDEARHRSVIIRAEKGKLAGLILPTAEQTWAVISLSLRPDATASLTGLAVDAQGNSIPNVLVRLNEVFFPVSESSVYAGQQILYTDASGRFTFDSLWPEGAYGMSIGGQAQRALPCPAYGIVGLPKNSKYTSDGYRLHAGEKRDLGRIVLPLADGIVSGRVVDRLEKPVAGIRVSINGKSTFSASNVTDADGQFRVEHLVREPLTLEISRERVGTGENNRSYKGVYGNDIYLTQPVQAGQTNLKLVIGAPLFAFDKPSAKP